MAESTDAALVSRTRAGDREAYGLLVSRYQGHVYGLAYSLTNDWAEAQDIAQETFLRAYMNLDQLQEPARFAAWLRRVAFSVTMNWLKSFRPELFRRLDGQVDLEALEVPDFVPGPPEVLERKELAQAVQRAVDSLPPKYRLPLTMFHLDGLSYEKVAGFLDIPLGTAKSLISRARRKLKEALGSYFSEETFPVVQEVFNEHKLRPEFAQQVLAAVHIYDQTFRETGDRYYQARPVELMRLVCLRAAGCEEVDYETLLALSGLGAAFAYHPQDYWVMYQPPEPPGVAEERIARATGCGWEWLPRWQSPEGAWQTLKATIDSGRPIEGNYAEEFLFGGYQEAALPEDRKVYAMGGFGKPSWWSWERFVEWATSGPDFWTFGRASGPVPRGSARDIAVEVLQGAARAGRHDGRAEVPFMAHAHYGFAGIEAYAADVVDLAKDPDWFYPGWLGCHCVNRQAHGRRCLAVYLRRAAAVFSPSVADHVSAAAEAYESAYGAWQEFSRHLGYLAGHTSLEPLKEEWRKPARRRAGAAAIRRALRHEKAAGAAARKALRAVAQGEKQC